MNEPNIPSQRRRDVLVAAACAVFVAAMVGAAYAAVPLYNWFCRTTGFGGTPQVATAAPSHVLDRKLKVRFDANVAASYNVSPPTAGAYFSKINCFCFTDQRLKAGEKRDMAVVFFVAPELVKDSEQDGLDTITLSYTMYPARQAETPQVDSGEAHASGRS